MPAAPTVDADEDRADASTPHGPPADTPGRDETTPAADATHGSVVSEVAKNADPEGGKGDEVAPVARDNHGVEARAEHQPEHPAPGSPAEPGGNAAQQQALTPPTPISAFIGDPRAAACSNARCGCPTR